MFLVFLPESRAFFLWPGDHADVGEHALSEFTHHARPGTATLVLPGGARRVTGWTLPVFAVGPPPKNQDPTVARVY